MHLHNILIVPPSFMVQPIDFNGTAGSFVSIKCIAAGVPLPIITWMKNDASLTTLNRVTITNTTSVNVTESVLFISNSNFTDNGLYKCVATNNLVEVSQTISSTAQIRILCKSLL